MAIGNKCGNGATTCIEAKDGTIIMEKEKILARWYEYIGDSHNDNRGKISVLTPEYESPLTYREVEYN